MTAITAAWLILLVLGFYRIRMAAFTCNDAMSVLQLIFCVFIVIETRGIPFFRLMTILTSRAESILVNIDYSVA